jgi:hypothetical protein
MNLTKYGFSNAVGAFFEMSTEDARRILPPHLEPVEVQHTRSILALTAFHFTESMVGAYDEIVLSIIVPPRVNAGQPLPKSAFYPFIVGTSTESSRLHAIERWHLPHYLADLEIELDEGDDRMDVHVREGRTPVLDFHVTPYAFQPVRHLYNSYMVNDGGRYKVNIYMEGPHSEHEEEQGELILHDHPFNSALRRNEVSRTAFREQWLKGGVQTFEEMEKF